MFLLDLLALASAMGHLVSGSRGARTAMFCALTLTTHHSLDTALATALTLPKHLQPKVETSGSSSPNTTPQETSRAFSRSPSVSSPSITSVLGFSCETVAGGSSKKLDCSLLSNGVKLSGQQCEANSNTGVEKSFIDTSSPSRSVVPQEQKHSSAAATSGYNLKTKMKP